MAWQDTIFKFLGLTRYNTITPALTNGQTSELQCDAQGRLLVNAESINTTWSDGGVVGPERAVKAAAGRVHQLFGRNTGASTRYFFVFNSATRPADGLTAALFVPIKVAAGEAFSIELPRPRAFSVGLFWAASSTDATFTYDAAATFATAVEYA